MRKSLAKGALSGLHRSWILLAAIFALLFWGCRRDEKVVVLYTSQDLIFAEPILREFTRKTGVRVKALYDSEAVKTAGLANRLLAEKDNPQCDVFWSNEELRARQLEQSEIFVPGSMVRVGHRRRYLVFNTNLVSAAGVPSSARELVEPAWRGKVVLAYPLFGTTTAHFLTLRQRWGERTWSDWCQALQKNQPLLVDGNSVVVQMVGRGEAWVGLTDSDDCAIGKKNGLPIDGRPLESDGLAIPNSIALVRGAPNPDAGRQLLEFLSRPEVAHELVKHLALEGVESLPGGVENWPKLLAELESSLRFLTKTFLR